MSKEIFSKGEIRKLFPILRKIDAGEIPYRVYADTAATSFRLDFSDSLEKMNTIAYGNIHRSAFRASYELTQWYEDSRNVIAQYLSVPSESVVFTSGATLGSNMISLLLDSSGIISLGDKIFLSPLDHHSTILPFIAKKEKNPICYASFDPATGRLHTPEHQAHIQEAKVLILTHISSVLGVKQEVELWAKYAREHRKILILDIAQSIAHEQIDLTSLGVDFAYFSGHKVFAPTGIGVLYVHPKWHSQIRPVFFGGSMLNSFDVEAKSIDPKEMPYSLEAGTMPLEQAILLGEAVKQMTKWGVPHIQAEEKRLQDATTQLLSAYPFVKVYPENPAYRAIPLFSFSVEGYHSHDIGTMLENASIEVRTGLLCSEGLMSLYGISGGLTRLSLQFFHQEKDLTYLEKAFSALGEFL